MAPKERNQHVVGLSIFDEATDFHGAVLIRMGSGGPMHNISGEEFTQEPFPRVGYKDILPLLFSGMTKKGFSGV